MGMRKPRTFGQKAFFWAITIMIAFGLVGGSVLMIFGGDDQPVTPVPQDDQQFTDFIQALEELENHVRDNPEDTASRMRLAGTYAGMGQYGVAIEQYEAILETNPEHEAARLSLAECYLALEKDDEALVQISQLLEVNPEHQFAHFLAGYILGDRKEDYPAAIERLERFVELAGSGPYVQEAQAMIDEWKGKTE